MRSSIVLISFVWVGTLTAQASTAPQLGDRSIGAWMGFSASSTVAGVGSQKRQLLLMGVRAEWVIESFGPVALAATSDIVPLALVTHNPTYIVRHLTVQGIEFEQKQPTGEKPVFGAGVAPFGFKLYLLHGRSLRLYGVGAVGGLWFTRNMPVPEARRFNASFEYGGGLELLRAPNRTVVVGYKFHHLSNANSAAFNPGLDSNVFYVGLSRPR